MNNQPDNVTDINAFRHQKERAAEDKASVAAIQDVTLIVEEIQRRDEIIQSAEDAINKFFGMEYPTDE